MIIPHANNLRNFKCYVVLVSLLEDEIWRRSWSNFQRDSKVFRYLDEVFVTGTLSP